jgi:hypothetical protein
LLNCCSFKWFLKFCYKFRRKKKDGKDEQWKMVGFKMEEMKTAFHSFSLRFAKLTKDEFSKVKRTLKFKNAIKLGCSSFFPWNLVFARQESRVFSCFVQKSRVISISFKDQNLVFSFFLLKISLVWSLKISC